MNQPRPGQAPGGTNISISGSPGSAIASGDRAQASGSFTQNQAAADTLRQIDRLLAELEAGARALPSAEAEDALDEIERVRAEVHHRRPKAESIRLTLTRLAGAVGGAVSLLAKVDEVAELVTHLVHLPGLHAVSDPGFRLGLPRRLRYAGAWR